MFSFTQLAEFETRHGHSWFWFSQKLLDCIDKQEQGDIWIEKTPHDGLVRVWFPSEKYFSQLEPEAFRRMINEAVEDNDFVKVKQLKERYKRDVSSPTT